MLRVRRRRGQRLGEQQRRALLRRRPRPAAPLRDRRAEVRDDHLPQRARRAVRFQRRRCGLAREGPRVGRPRLLDGQGAPLLRRQRARRKGPVLFRRGLRRAVRRREGAAALRRHAQLPGRPSAVALSICTARSGSASRSLSWCSATRCSGRRAPTTTCGTRRRIHRSRSLCRSTRRRSRRAFTTGTTRRASASGATPTCATSSWLGSTTSSSMLGPTRWARMGRSSSSLRTTSSPRPPRRSRRSSAPSTTGQTARRRQRAAPARQTS